MAVLGVTAYRGAFGQPKAIVGRQPQTLEGAELWVLPNTSGLNAHYQLPQLVTLFADFRESIGRPSGLPDANKEPG